MWKQCSGKSDSFGDAEGNGGAGPADAERTLFPVSTDTSANHGGDRRAKPRGRAQPRSAQQELLDLLAESKSPKL